MELSAAELWARILESARTGLPEQTFRTWLSGARPSLLTGEELRLEAPSQFHVEWIEDKYGGTLHEIARSVLGRPIRIHFTSSAPSTARELPTLELEHNGAEGIRPPPDPAQPAQLGLNDRYTFERFVVGANNQLASAASRAVADRPAKMYNPLFLYGGTGLGKTHLMHAIGIHILEHTPSTQIAYVPTEQFMNELVTGIQEGSTPEFRRRYRRMDLLLVDDVHVLAGKERTQEEFFHTFNALYDAGHQIVLTSDRPPKEIPGLEERLVSRFEWGLVVDIKPPDYETRVAILRKKAADDDLTLDDDVIDFIARSCTSSVRELEGAVIKLLAYSSLTHRDVTVALARTALDGMLRGGEDAHRLTPERIRDVVATRWNVKPAALTSSRRSRDVTEPRQVAMYLIKEILGIPLIQIGKVFGGRDHSTVIHSIRKVEGSLERDRELQDRIEEIRQELVELH